MNIKRAQWTTLLLPFIVLSATGFLLSIVAHVASLLGATVPGGKLVWALHMGIFVVWFPALLVSYRINGGRAQGDLWKYVLSDWPKWVRYAAYGLVAYGIVNFILFIITTESGPQPDGDAPPSIIRGFSGHWMIFYGAAFMILTSVYLNPALLKKKK